MAGIGRWVKAELVAVRTESATARTLFLDAPDLAPALAGQHVDVRLTADDGYTAQRSYSLASAAGRRPIELTVERLDDGEVSPYLVDDLRIGDAVEVRGPIGGWFAWRPEQTEPVQLIGGGSGVVPLMSMVRTHAAVGGAAPMRLLASVRDPTRALYADELDRLAGPSFTVTTRWTRRAPAGGGPVGRIDAELLQRVAVPADDRPTMYVCGSTGFVEAVAGLLTAAGHEASRIRTERFGPTGIA